MALKEFQGLCLKDIVIIAIDNTKMIAYIKVKPSVCPSVENPDLVRQKQVTLKA